MGFHITPLAACSRKVDLAGRRPEEGRFRAAVTHRQALKGKRLSGLAVKQQHSARGLNDPAGFVQ